ITTFTIKARDGYDIPVRSYIPCQGGAESRGLLVYIHAGGFLFGDLESGDFNCQILASRLNLTVLNVDHRLAPKWPFPYGVNDAYDAVQWVTHAAQHLAASPSVAFLVGGISSGANFAGVIAYTARDEGLSPPLTGVFLSIPVALWPNAYHLVPSEWSDQLQSTKQNSDAPLLTVKGLELIQEAYKADAGDTRISFLLNKDHSNLPTRAYFQICGLDPLRDEAFLWEKLIRKHSSTKSKLHIYSGLPHGFWRFAQIDASQKWLDDLIEGIRFLL
ncbi:Alpha/Beta hydrolase protein, partial [Truncatella angustata]